MIILVKNINEIQLVYEKTININYNQSGHFHHIIKSIYFFTPRFINKMNFISVYLH